MAKREWGMPSEHKSFPAILLKADSDKGIVEHLIAVMGNVDLGQDRIIPGAFTKTISERGKRVKVLDLHNIDSIGSVIGKPMELREISKAELPPEVKEKYPEATGALKATTQFLMDTPEGKGAFIRIKEGAIDEWSFGYDATIKDYVEEQLEGETVNIRNLVELKLYEYSPVIFGMNPAPVTISAKDVEGPEAVKPYPNEHACRLRDPGDFQEGSFRRTTRDHDGKEYAVIMGRLEGETTLTEQAYRYPKDDWTADTAKTHCQDHDGSFEAASEESSAPAPGNWGDNLTARGVVMFKANFDEMFDAMLQQEELMEARWRMESAFYRSMDSILSDEDISPPEKLGLASITFDQYKTAYLGWIAQLLAVAKDEELELDTKEGRVLSSRNATRIRNALAEISSVLKAAGLLEDDDKGDVPALEGAAGDHSDKTNEAGPSDQTPTLEEIEVAQLELQMMELATMTKEG